MSVKFVKTLVLTGVIALIWARWEMDQLHGYD